MFSDAEIAALYALDCRAHDQDAEQSCLDAGLGVSMHTIRRVTTPEADRLLPWSEEDRYAIEVAQRESRPAPLEEDSTPASEDEPTLF